MTTAENKPIVLVSEDDGATREALLAILADEGYATRAVANIADARRQLASDPFAVLLLDSQHADGPHGADWIVDFVDHEGAPRTIIVSGATDALEVGKRFGVPVVPKPFDIDQLLAAIVAVTTSTARARERTSRP